MKRFYGMKNLKSQLRKIIQTHSAHQERTSVLAPSGQFQMRKRKAIKTGETLLKAVSDELTRGQRSNLELRLEHLCSLFDLVQLADEATKLVGGNPPTPSQEAEPYPPQYIIGSWFLSKCASYLTSNPNGHERLHLVTGIKLSPKNRTLDNMVKVALASNSAVGALADQHALQNALIEMDEWGHYLHGLFHSHPGQGSKATRPSSTDLTTHQRYESGGYPLIGAIFVKDGFVRFFGHHPFTVTIHGKGVEQIDEHEHVFAIRNLSHKTP